MALTSSMGVFAFRIEGFFAADEDLFADKPVQLESNLFVQHEVVDLLAGFKVLSITGRGLISSVRRTMPSRVTIRTAFRSRVW